MEPRIIEGEEILDIAQIAGPKPYKETKEGSKNHGKNFLTFMFDGKAFTVNEEDEFVKLYLEESLYRVKLGLVEREDKKGEYSWQVQSAASNEKVMKLANTAAQINAVRTNFKPAALVSLENAEQAS
jgi:hypothetical protein